FFFFSSRRRHTRCYRDWSSDVCSSDLVLLPDTDEQGAIGVAGALNGALDAAFAVADQTLHVGSSIGVALAPVHGTDSHTLLQCADRKSTRLNSSHGSTSYAVFCLKKNI